MKAILAVCFLLFTLTLAGCGTSHHTAYVTTPLNGGVLAFRISSATGRMSVVPGSPYQAGLSPTAVVVHPNRKYAYVSNGGEANISLFKIDSFGALTEVMPRTRTGTNPSSLVLDSAGAFLYVTNAVSNTVSVFSVDANSGQLQQAPGSPYNTGFNPVRLALTPSGKFLYVANGSGSSISGFAVASGA